MALRACNNPQITGPVLSSEITKLVISHAEAEVGRLLQKRKADAVGELISFARGDGGIGEAGGGGASKRQRCNGGTATEVSPISEAGETQEKPEREASLRRARPAYQGPLRVAPRRRPRRSPPERGLGEVSAARGGDQLAAIRWAGGARSHAAPRARSNAPSNRRGGGHPCGGAARASALRSGQRSFSEASLRRETLRLAPIAPTAPGETPLLDIAPLGTPSTLDPTSH